MGGGGGVTTVLWTKAGHYRKRFENHLVLFSAFEPLMNHDQKTECHNSDWCEINQLIDSLTFRFNVWFYRGTVCQGKNTSLTSACVEQF